MPDGFVGQFVSPRFSHLVDTTKHFTGRDVRSLEPLVENLFHPSGHGNRAGMTRLSLEVNNRPMLFALQYVADIQFHCFMASYTTCKQYGEERSIPFLLQSLTVASRPQSLRLFGGERVS